MNGGEVAQQNIMLALLVDTPGKLSTAVLELRSVARPITLQVRGGPGDKSCLSGRNVDKNLKSRIHSDDSVPLPPSTGKGFELPARDSKNVTLT
nr:hypothetical protein BgiMline_027013 [Biomphalaria glabrata]